MLDLLDRQPKVPSNIIGHFRHGALLLGANIICFPHMTLVEDDVEGFSHIIYVEIAPCGLA